VAKGFCRKCGKQVGSFMKPPGWQCPRCNFVFCEDCSPKLGSVFKKPACPDCGVAMAQ